MHLPRSSALLTAGILSFVTLCSGCGTSPPGDLSNSRPNSEPSGTVDSSVREDEYNNSAFEAAQAATLPASGKITITGGFDSLSDVDIYSLGAVSAGDRITVQVTGHEGLNTVAALFNAASDLIDANDDRSYYGGLTDPYMSRVLRADGDNLYLGIAISQASHFASNQGRHPGNYSIDVTREPGAPVKAAEHQLVYMDFEGGENVQIGLEPITTMRPFSAESISSRLAGKSDYIIGLVVDHMERDFSPYNVTLLDSRNTPRPTEAHTGLFFGNYNSKYLGLADNVDTYNSFLEQDAIIYTEDIQMFEALVPSAEEVAMAIANVGSHELGHLLGLEHSGEAHDVMATAATARQILESDAYFSRSTMQSDVFPLGFQNEPDLLMMNVGANPAGAASRFRLEDLLPAKAGVWRDLAKVEDIPITPCARCARHRSE